MASPFATLESRSASAVVKHLANAQAIAVDRYSEVVSFPVIFDNGYADQMAGLVDAVQPTIRALSADVADLVQGCPVEIGEDDYTVADIKPDGTGTTTIQLRKP